MFALDLYETARDMWLSIRSQDVMELPGEEAGLSELHQFLHEVVRDGGMDVTPLEEDRGPCAGRTGPADRPGAAGPGHGGKKGPQTPGADPGWITEGKLKDYLLASAACFPALRARSIDGIQYLDGGYGDNMPTALAARMGAEELVCVDLEGVGITRPNRTGLPTILVRSHWNLGDILRFDPEVAQRNMALGYFDTLRAFGRIRGCAYAVDDEGQSAADASRFAARFAAIQRAVLAEYPVTWTAGAALRLSKLRDQALAPLEAAAEDMEVDPTRYYTVKTLSAAFLDRCDYGRIRVFFPLLDGQGSAALAARAAVAPSTFLQAMVYRALTLPPPAPPKITEVTKA